MVPVFAWFGRKSEAAPPGDVVAAQPHGQLFPWPKGAVLTAVDEVVLALPLALFDKDRPMGEFIFGESDLQMTIPPGGDKIFIRLMPGMSVRLAKSVQSYVVSDDRKPRRIKLTPPPAGG
jgi:hypothetical protein